MEKQNVLKLVTLLEESKKILIAAGETEFEYLGRRAKSEIYDLFENLFNGESDGDSDGISVNFGFEDFEAVFFSSCRDRDDFKRDLHSLCFNYHRDQFEASIQEIDKANAYLRSLSPEVVGVLNTSILTASGEYILKEITLERAQEIAQNYTLDSAIGHKSTAQILTTLLGVNIPVNRQQFSQNVGQQCLVFKLRGRLEEGKILTVAEIEQYGYDLHLLVRNQ